VKWAGGKQWLSSAASDLAPPGRYGRYYEPFLGGGSFFFSLQPKSASLSDKNGELITAYRAIRENPEGVINLLQTFPYQKGFYYRLRGSAGKSPVSIAARLIYLNRTCWNGLYRVNSKGEFNTPFGQYSNPTICDPERIRAVARVLRRVEIRIADFAAAVARARGGDFVYFDPPYVTRDTQNSFLHYNSQLFSWSDQERLSSLSKSLATRGVHILVSNTDHPGVVRLYKGFYYYRVKRRSLIGGQTNSRGTVTEALFSSYPLLGHDSEVF
jgi:DNA adenine methylase